MDAIFTGAKEEKIGTREPGHPQFKGKNRGQEVSLRDWNRKAVSHRGPF